MATLVPLPLFLLATVPHHFFVLSKSGNEPSQHVINIRRRRGRGDLRVWTACQTDSDSPSKSEGRKGRRVGIARKAPSHCSLSSGNRKTTSLFTFMLFIAAIQSVPPRPPVPKLGSPLPLCSFCFSIRYSLRSSVRPALAAKLSLLRKWRRPAG